MRASVFGFREVEAEEGCVVTELPGTSLLGLLKERERLPWWLWILCARSYLVSTFAMNLLLETPFSLSLEEASKDGIEIEDPERRRIVDVQLRGKAWWISLTFSEAFLGPGQSAGFSTFEAAFLGGPGEEKAAFRILYRIDMRERQCEVGVQYRGVRLIWAILSQKSAQWGWDLSLGRMDGMKAAVTSEVPSEDIPAMQLFLAADVGDGRERVGRRGAGRWTRSRPVR
jgi:hypothetical protein